MVCDTLTSKLCSLNKCRWQERKGTMKKIKSRSPEIFKKVNADKGRMDCQKVRTGCGSIESSLITSATLLLKDQATKRSELEDHLFFKVSVLLL